MESDVLRTLTDLVHALVNAGTNYALGGSIASSAHGEPRSTQDIDVVADLHGTAAEALIAAMNERFTVDEEMVYSTVLHGGSFNVLHRETFYKVDVFPWDGSERIKAELERANDTTISIGSSTVSARMASAEDIILAKLLWYRDGGQVSDRQWRDVLGVIKVTGLRIDMPYLRLWTARLNIDDLLAKALADAGGGG